MLKIFVTNDIKQDFYIYKIENKYMRNHVDEDLILC